MKRGLFSTYLQLESDKNRLNQKYLTLSAGYKIVNVIVLPVIRGGTQRPFGA